MLDTIKNFDKYFIGIDTLFDRVAAAQETALKYAKNYPPFNIKKVDSNRYVIEMAVAGFGKQDIDIELEGSKLVIKGNTKKTDEPTEENQTDWPQILYQGLALRPFTRSFEIADHVEIKGADLINGILKIGLEMITPEANKPVKININEKEV